MPREDDSLPPLNEPFRHGVNDVLAAADTDVEQGLSVREARRRRERYGANRLSPAERRSTLGILVDQFKSLVFALLALAGLLSVVIGEVIQGAAIVVAMLINAAIGFSMELRATRSMEALRRLERSTARLRRGGREIEVASDEIVPGDIILLDAGELVPADLRLVTADGLRMDESALTGEAMPADKRTDPLKGTPPLAECENIAWKGTAVVQGEGVGVVVATGMQTELGRIASLAEAAEGERTPLEKRLDQLSRRLLVAIIAVSAFVSAVGIFAGRDVLLMVETGVALVVAAVPEGLPIVASIALARGMWRLAGRNALVKRLSAVETLGATNIICADKTGTLTENRMTLGRIVLDRGVATAGEEGWTLGDAPLDAAEAPDLDAALTVAVLCNDAELGDEREEDEGDPMEIALLRAGLPSDHERARLLEDMPELDRTDFDPEIKMMASQHRVGDEVRVAVKGAPEAVLEVCTSVLTGDGDTRPLDADAADAWRGRNEDLAGRGLRALALGQKTVPDETSEPYADLTLIGLVGLVDPPRAEVRDAVLDCRRAGIRAVMVTGDQPSTARAIAGDVGLVDDPQDARVVGGDEMKPDEAFSDAERADLLDAAIFARFSPEQKLDLIELYQREGLVVAMTGDGVNDAPALKKADIGVAMGRRGTEVAREAADMVLLDDSFASIVNAVHEGRNIFGNIRKFVVYMLSGNTAEILAVSILALLNAPLPLLPLQILFINIVSDVFPALALGVSGSEGREMSRAPRDPEEPILTGRLWRAVGGYGFLLAVSVMAVFAAAFGLGLGPEKAVTVSFLTFGFARLWHVFNMRDPGTGLVFNEVTRNLWVWVALGIGVVLMLAATWLPPLAQVLSTTPPGLAGWGLIAIGSLVPLAVGQLLKAGRVRSILGLEPA